MSAKGHVRVDFDATSPVWGIISVKAGGPDLSIEGIDHPKIPIRQLFKFEIRIQRPWQVHPAFTTMTGTPRGLARFLRYSAS
jgi:hypothetical protein